MYTFSSLTKYLDSILVREKIPSFNCRVFHKGKEVFRHLGGYKDREEGIKLQGDEYYFMYSASKPITCAAALHAYEEGKFLIGDPVWWYLPEFRNCKVKNTLPNGEIELVPLKRDILIHDLFSMQAGLNYDTENIEIRSIGNKDPNASTREIMKGIAKIPLEFQPGDNFNYSLCHDVLAAVVEVATGKRFSDYVKEVIFDPLGMTHSTYRINDEIIEKMAQQYRHNYATGEAELFGKKNNYIFSNEYDSGGAGIISTMDDYAKFVYAMTNYGVGENGRRILARSTIDLMRTNVLSGKSLESFSSWDTNREYGYGYGVRTKIGEGRGGNLSSKGEFGWDGAAGSFLSIDPERQIGIIYTQHMLNPLNNITHARIRTLATLALGY